MEFIYKFAVYFEEIEIQMFALKNKTVPFASVGKVGSISSQCVVQCFWEVTRKEPKDMFIIQKKRELSWIDNDKNDKFYINHPDDSVLGKCADI